ncbi:MAG: Glu/Leu/Phe/Val dehydrogenase, partial [Deltaproteobacteria bacterium]|nr:Glu/Leu/Phe/Val dehydrogenase [Deltaproteobacteria bacterium]
AFIHKTRRGQAAGGTRFWRYETVADFVRDGLRLSRGMGQKCALAGLWWGGGKGVIARRADANHKNPELRGQVYRDYGRMMSGLRGLYVTAEDVGTTPPDMAQIFTTSRHTTCIPNSMGGSGNPSALTATGVVVGMEAALHHLGLGTLAGKTVAMQGLGNVAIAMIGDLLERHVSRIIGCDIEQEVINKVHEHYPGAPLELQVVVLDDERILFEEADVLVPNATGAILNPRTIPAIKAKVICGAANNQLELSTRDGRALKERGVLYVPDFLANRMGIVNCANEQYGWFEHDPAIEAHLQREPEHGIFQRALEVFRRAEKSERCNAEEAELLAEELMEQPHRIWPDRGQQIIDYLLRSSWTSR